MPVLPVAPTTRLLVFGSRGWIGAQALPHLRARFDAVVEAADSGVRADDDEAVRALLERERPTHVLSLVGRTHGPGHATIDYLELPGKLRENVRDNLYSPVALALLCDRAGAHFTYMGTGCIFSAVDPAEAEPFGEDDAPNFFGSAYSTVKGFTDRLMHLLPRALNVRIRMPITAEDHPRNFVSKILRYERVCSVPNSMSVLPTLLPRLADMMVAGEAGTVHLVNPGLISHNEILGMYRELVDPGFQWRNFSIEEQDAVLAAQRSNNHLCTAALSARCPGVPGIREAVRACLCGGGFPRLSAPSAPSAPSAAAEEEAAFWSDAQRGRVRTAEPPSQQATYPEARPGQLPA